MKAVSKKTLVLVALPLLVMLVSQVNAQEIPLAKQKKVFVPAVSAYYVIGSGIMVNPSNLDEFALAKIAAGKIRVLVPQINESHEFKIGVLIVDGNRYLLRNASVVNGTFTADIYSNGTLVGGVELHMVLKGDRIVWTGSVVIGDSEYRAYIMEMARAWNRGEIVSEAREKGLQACKVNPDSIKCKEELKDWCEDHITDARCRALVMSDKKYREHFREKIKEMSEWCREHPAKCQELRPEIGKHFNKSEIMEKMRKVREENEFTHTNEVENEREEVEVNENVSVNISG